MSKSTTTAPPEGYKNTAIGVIPVEWEVKKLSDLCFNKGEYGINAAAVDFKDDLPAYIRITDIDDDGYFSSSKKCSVDDINSSNFYLNKNDIIFVRTGAATGKTYLYNENDGKLVFAGFLIRFKVDINKVNDYFLWSYTQSKPYWDWVKTVCTRSGQPGINSTEYASIQLPIPPQPEQQKIAEILSTWDEAIAKCKATITTIKDRNKGLAQQLLTGKKRLKGFNDKWEVKSLGEMGTIVNGLTYSPDDVLDNGLLVLRSSNIQDNKLSFKNNVFVSNEINYNPVYENDILICVRNGSKDLIGKNIIIPKEIEGYAFGAFMIIYRSSLNKFLIHLFKTKLFYKEVHKNLGATINSINNNDFKKFQFKIPSSFEEQTAIAQVLETANQELKSYETKLETLQLQKKGLMQQLLTGKIRVNVK